VKTLLVDGDNLFKIGFHGVRDFFVEGEHIGGVFHFLNTIRRQLDENEFDKVIVFWDGKNNSQSRRELYPDYKLNRRNDMTEAKLESYYFQKSRVKQYLEECFVRQIEVDGNESDDLIAYYCSLATDEEKVVFSSDRDLLQIISENTSIYSPIKKISYNYGDKIKFGDVHIPHQNVLVVKVFLGDKSDNIFGIDRLGEKTFIKLFPEIVDNVLTVTDILDKTNKLISENRKETILHNIKNGKTKKGQIGDEFFRINQQIVDLRNPIITDDAKEFVTLYYSETLDPEGRDNKNLIRLMMEDGFFKYLPKDDDAFVNFMKPFTKLTRKEKRKYKQSNN